MVEVRVADFYGPELNAPGGRAGKATLERIVKGRHVVCAVVTAEFLSFTKSMGNDLTTPRPEFGFEGLVPGDRWCLCASRWEEARIAGFAPDVVLEATHQRALETIALGHLQAHAAG